MPRQRSAAPARRPTAAPARPTAPAPPRPAPARHSSTAAAPPQNAPQQQAAAPQASQGPGLFGQMASTAAGVAVGSSIGHALGGMFGGGGGAAAAPESAQSTDFAQQHQASASGYSQDQQQSGACANDVHAFRKCMDDNQGSLTVCGWYLDQLKACQQAAGQY